MDKTYSFRKHLPSGFNEGNGEQVVLGGHQCLYFSDSMSVTEVENGSKGSFDFPHCLVVLKGGDPVRIIRCEVMRFGDSAALCMISQDGRHSYCDEVEESISRDQFLALAAEHTQTG